MPRDIHAEDGIVDGVPRAHVRMPGPGPQRCGAPRDALAQADGKPRTRYSTTAKVTVTSRAFTISSSVASGSYFPIARHLHPLLRDQCAAYASSIAVRMDSTVKDVAHFAPALRSGSGVGFGYLIFTAMSLFPSTLA